MGWLYQQYSIHFFHPSMKKKYTWLQKFSVKSLSFQCWNKWAFSRKFFLKKDFCVKILNSSVFGIQVKSGSYRHLCADDAWLCFHYYNIKLTLAYKMVIQRGYTKYRSGETLHIPVHKRNYVPIQKMAWVSNPKWVWKMPWVQIWKEKDRTKL